MPDVRKHAPENVPLILVGTKADLRAEGQAKVTEEEVGSLVGELPLLLHAGISPLRPPLCGV